MKTTLNEIRKYSPCASGWEKLLKHLGKTKADDEDMDLMAVLESNGIQDAIWCLRVFDYKDYCLFLADIAESVLDIFEKRYPENKAPRNAVKAIRDFHNGVISRDKLDDDAAAAYDAAAAAYAAYAAARFKKLEEIEQLFIKHFEV